MSLIRIPPAFAFFLLLPPWVQESSAVPVPVALDVVPDILGTGWEQTMSGGFFPTWSLSPSGEHSVTVTLSDGHSDVFFMALNPSSQLLIPILFTEIFFIPAPGTLGSLAPIGGTLAVVSPSGVPGPTELLDFNSFTPIDPLFYLYTLDETQYVVPKGFRAAPEPVLLGLLLLSSAVLLRLRRGPSDAVEGAPTPCDRDS